MNNYLPRLVFLVRQEDLVLHTEGHPFCNDGDPQCPCRSDEDALHEASTFIQDGLMGEEEARRFVEGRTV